MALSTKLPFPLIACVLLHVSTSAAQTLATTGAITGTVTDTTGAVVAGTKVVLTSESLMRSRTVSTNEEGVYRIAAIPSGEYSLVFTRDGFATKRRDTVRVSIGFTATVNAVLEVDGVYDHVTVESGASATDRQTTAISASFDARQFADLPNSRSLFAILAAAPAIHVTRFEVGGSSGDGGSPYGVYGTVGSNRPMIEGIGISGVFPTGFMLNYGAFAEASVRLAAHDAEWPLFGVHVQVVTKAEETATTPRFTRIMRTATGNLTTSTPSSSIGVRLVEPSRLRERQIACGRIVTSMLILGATSRRTQSGGTFPVAIRIWQPRR